MILLQGGIVIACVAKIYLFPIAAPEVYATFSKPRFVLDFLGKTAVAEPSFGQKSTAG